MQIERSRLEIVRPILRFGSNKLVLNEVDVVIEREFNERTFWAFKRPNMWNNSNLYVSLYTSDGS